MLNGKRRKSNPVEAFVFFSMSDFFAGVSIAMVCLGRFGRHGFLITREAHPAAFWFDVALGFGAALATLALGFHMVNRD
jgi:hypothetical protein